MTKRGPFRCFRTSPKIIRLAGMKFKRFLVSLRKVKDPLHERGIDLSYESVRFWWLQFGPMFAAEICKKRSQLMRFHSNWKRHLDEVFVKINCQLHCLWRAVDHEGEVLESYVTKTRDKKAALKFTKKLMRRHGQPHKIATGKLRTYCAAMKEIGNTDRQATGCWLKNRTENSHPPFRRRERAMQRFRRL